MPSMDLCACVNSACTIKDHCWRFRLGERMEMGQTYSEFAQKENGTCDHYYPMCGFRYKKLAKAEE